MCYRRESPSLLTRIPWTLYMTTSIQKRVPDCDDVALRGGEDAPGDTTVSVCPPPSQLDRAAALMEPLQCQPDVPAVLPLKAPWWTAPCVGHCGEG